jgi:ABC-type Fe3+/spermidine/putrescine transport system ATPase subunit
VTDLPPYELFPHMSVGEKVEYGLPVSKVDREERRRGERATRVLPHGQSRRSKCPAWCPYTGP